jgi:hypothetical protein
MTINLDQYTNTLNVTDTATNADLNVTTKGTGSHVFNTASGVGAKVIDSATTNTSFLTLKGGVNGGNTQFYVSGTGSTELWQSSLGTGAIRFQTNAGAQEQFRISHTASAVNYVNITGAATGSGPTISAQGSDTNVNLFVNPKGTGALVVNPSGGYQFTVINTPSAVNWLEAKGGATGSGPQISAVGTDTNIDLNLTAKGTGVVVATGGTLQAATTGSNGNLYLGGPNVSLRSAYSANVFGMYTNNAEQVRIGNVASAVNYIQLVGAATGSGPIISAQGSDTNIGLTLSNKGVGSTTVTGNSGTHFRVRTDIGSATNYWEAFGSTSFPILRSTHTSGAIQISGGPLIIQTDTSGATQLTVAHTASAVNYVQVTGAATGNIPTISVQGSDTNINFSHTTKGSGYHLFYSDNGASPQFSIARAASTVNYVEVIGSATGGRPLVSVQGSDTNINMGVLAKGSGVVYLQSGLGASLEASATGNANYFSMVGTAAGTDPVLTVKGSDTNIDLVLQPKGTGALQAQQTDSTATGGNARGANAVDWSTGRNAATQVASGLAATIGGGRNNTASGIGSVVAGGGTFAGGVDPNIVSGAASVISGGAQNTNSGFLAVIAGGYNNATSNSGTVVSGGWNNVATGQFSSTVGGYGNNASGIYNFIGGGYVNSGTTLSIITTQSATMNGTTAVTLSGSNASIKVGQYIVGTYISGDTYVAAVSGTSLTLSQAASGSGTATLSFYTPHGVVVGGGRNTATGSYSFIGGGGDAGTAGNRNVASGDWSVVGGGRANTASGIGAFVGGGGVFAGVPYPNTASGNGAVVVGGFSNTASGQSAFIGCGYANIANSLHSAVVGGSYGTTRSIWANQVFSACVNPISAASGVSQAALIVLARQTTDATATVLTNDSNAASTLNQVILPNNSAYFFTGEVVAGVTGGGNTKGWTIEGVIKRGANAASTALVGTPTVTSTYADAGASTWVIAVTADTTNGGLAVTFTGQASTTIRTVCQVRTTEMTY